MPEVRVRNAVQEGRPVLYDVTIRDGPISRYVTASKPYQYFTFQFPDMDESA